MTPKSEAPTPLGAVAIGAVLPGGKVTKHGQLYLLLRNFERETMFN